MISGPWSKVVVNTVRHDLKLLDVLVRYQWVFLVTYWWSYYYKQLSSNSRGNILSSCMLYYLKEHNTGGAHTNTKKDFVGIAVASIAWRWGALLLNKQFLYIANNSIQEKMCIPFQLLHYLCWSYMIVTPKTSWCGYKYVLTNIKWYQ